MIWLFVMLLVTSCASPDSASLRVRDVRRGDNPVRSNDSGTAAAEPLQTMNGPGFRALLAAVGTRCPNSRVRYATPAALLDADETFEETLDSTASRRLRAAKHLTPAGDYPRCAGRDGASCPANEAMNALERASLLDRFARVVCAHGASPWG